MRVKEIPNSCDHEKPETLLTAKLVTETLDVVQDYFPELEELSDTKVNGFQEQLEKRFSASLKKNGRCAD